MRYSVLSWNVQRPGPGRIDGVIDAISRLDTDLLTLQEANSRVAERLQDLGYTQQYHGIRHSPPGLEAFRREKKRTHGVLVACHTRMNARFVPEVDWVANACAPHLFGRVQVSLADHSLDLISAHIPNGSQNGWMKVHHCRVLADVLRRAPTGTRILTGDFNEPRVFLDDGRVVPFGGALDGTSILRLDDPASEGAEGLPGPHTCGEWDRRVAELFAPSYTGLTHALITAGGSLRPMQVTHSTGANPRFFDHAFVSYDLDVEIEYLHELRKTETNEGVSDHSPLLLNLQPRGLSQRPEWA